LNRVLVTGASGRLGTELTRHLAHHGWSVRCLVHRRPVTDGYECVEGSLEDAGSLVRATRGIDAVVHLAAVTHSRRARTYFRTNAEGTENLVAGALRNGVERLVLVSTRAISEQGGAYSRSKRAAEEAVSRSRLPHVIVRLPELYGLGGTEGVGRIIELAERNSLIPLVGGAEQVCPMYAEDAVFACEGALNTVEGIGRTFTLAGECVSLHDFAAVVLSVLNSRSRTITIPTPAVRVLGLVARVLPLPIYPDQLARLQAPKPSRTVDAPTLLGFSPTPLEVGLVASRARAASAP
jgi:2-alkyl-3-oxoalkanoate reductase